MYCGLDIFKNKYHLRCRFTKLTYCTCAEGSKDFHYSGDGELNSMFGQAVPSSQIHDLLRILAESPELNVSQKPGLIDYRQVEQTVRREREELMRQYERDRKRKRELAQDNGSCSEHQDGVETSVNSNGEASQVDEQETQVSAPAPIPKCFYEECSEEDSPDELVECTECYKTFHPGCCYPSFSINIGHSFPWVCSDCYKCVTCRRSDRVNSQVFCDICSRCFHINCLNPKLFKVPRNLWFCDECKICSRCHIQIDFPSKDGAIDVDSLPEGFDFLERKHGTRVCAECRDVEKELMCNVCNRVLDITGNRVCSLCRIHVHKGCLNGQICKLCDQ